MCIPVLHFIPSPFFNSQHFDFVLCQQKDCWFSPDTNYHHCLANNSVVHARHSIVLSVCGIAVMGVECEREQAERWALMWTEFYFKLSEQRRTWNTWIFGMESCFYLSSCYSHFNHFISRVVFMLVSCGSAYTIKHLFIKRVYFWLTLYSTHLMLNSWIILVWVDISVSS